MPADSPSGSPSSDDQTDNAGRPAARGGSGSDALVEVLMRQQREREAGRKRTVAGAGRRGTRWARLGLSVIGLVGLGYVGLQWVARSERGLAAAMGPMRWLYRSPMGKILRTPTWRQWSAGVVEWAPTFLGPTPERGAAPRPPGLPASLPRGNPTPSQRPLSGDAMARVRARLDSAGWLNLERNVPGAAGPVEYSKFLELDSACPRIQWIPPDGAWLKINRLSAPLSGLSAAIAEDGLLVALGAAKADSPMPELDEFGKSLRDRWFSETRLQFNQPRRSECRGLPVLDFYGPMNWGSVSTSGLMRVFIDRGACGVLVLVNDPASARPVDELRTLADRIEVLAASPGRLEAPHPTQLSSEFSLCLGLRAAEDDRNAEAEAWLQAATAAGPPEATNAWCEWLGEHHRLPEALECLRRLRPQHAHDPLFSARSVRWLVSIGETDWAHQWLADSASSRQLDLDETEKMMADLCHKEDWDQAAKLLAYLAEKLPDDRWDRWVSRLPETSMAQAQSALLADSGATPPASPKAAPPPIDGHSLRRPDPAELQVILKDYPHFLPSASAELSEYLALILGAYEQIGHRAPAWDDAMRRALTIWCVAIADDDSVFGTPHQHLWADSARAAHVAGCRDPLLLQMRAALAGTGVEAINFDVLLARESFKNIEALLNQHPYPALLQTWIYKRAVRARMTIPDTNAEWDMRAKSWMARALELLPAGAADTRHDGLSAAAVLDVLDLDTKRGGLRLESFEALRPRLSRALRSRPECAALCEGKVLIAAAWDARGSGLASSVTPAGHDRFEQRLEKAGQILLSLMKKNPANPHPWPPMFNVAMGLGFDDTQKLGLVEGALKAGVAPSSVHQRALAALAPKWGGSPHSQLLIVRQAIAEGHWLERGPLALATLYELAFQDVGDRLLESGRDQIWSELNSIYSNYLNRHPTNAVARGEFARWAIRCRQFETADAQLALLRNPLLPSGGLQGFGTSALTHELQKTRARLAAIHPQ